MIATTEYSAPWGTTLKLTTVLASAVLVGVAIGGIVMGAEQSPLIGAAVIVLPLMILLGSVLFVIRGYKVAAGRLWIKRLLWQSTLSLDRLTTAEVDPEAMKRSVRTFGNGGLFCFAGRFWNKKLGSYRAYATDPKLAVVLKFGDRVVVVTPDDPAKLAAQLTADK